MQRDCWAIVLHVRRVVWYPIALGLTSTLSALLVGYFKGWLNARHAHLMNGDTGAIPGFKPLAVARE